jgi:hypothetical protein
VATCSFCGGPTGDGNAFHAECQDRHRKATVAIPGFFGRILDSGISAARFADLLREAADASFVGSGDLNDLCLEGVCGLVSDILEHRLVTEAEEQRIGEILRTLNPQLLHAPGLVALFAKNEILRSLSEGKVPDRVEVVGDLPVALRKTESVLWIFNQMKFTSSGQRPIAPHEMPPPLTGSYYAHGAFTARAAAAQRKGRAGNLVLTNYNVFFVSSPTEHRAFPISRIAGLRARIDAVEIGYPTKIFTFSVADPWFLANALAFLSRRFRGNDDSGRTSTGLVTA